MKPGITALKSIIFLVVIPGMVLFYIPIRLGRRKKVLNRSRLSWHYLAPFMWLAGGAALLWSTWDFLVKGRGTPAPIDPPEELVVRGLYRYVRNPMYVGGLLILAGHFLWFQSRKLLLYAGGLFLAFHNFVVFYEEPDLRHRFGAAYERYYQSVPRWIPRVLR